MIKLNEWKVTVFVITITLFSLGLTYAENKSSKKEDTKRECQFSGSIAVQIFSRQPDSNWNDWDRLDTPKTTFDFKVTPVATPEMRVDTKYEYVGITLNGRRVRVKLKEPGRLRYEPSLGVVQLEIPFKLELDNAKIGLPLKLTTEAARSPKGEVQGTRVHLITDLQGATLSLVGGSMLTGTASLEEARTATGSKMQTGMKEYLILVQSQGTVTWK